MQSKKGEIVYHASHGVFAEGTMSSNFTVDDDHVLVMNGGKYTPSSTSELLTLIGPVVPPINRLEFGLRYWLVDIMKQQKKFLLILKEAK